MKTQAKKPSLKRIIILLIIYIFLFLTLFFFLDYYAFYIINPYILIILSVILGAVSTYFHIKSSSKSRIDDIVDKLE